jgi:signal transduction histidine kinase
VINPFQSASFRIAAAQAAVSLLTLIVLAGSLWWLTAIRFDDELTNRVQGDARGLMVLIETAGTDAAIADINSRVGDGFDEDEILVLTDPNFEREAGNFPAWPIGAPLTPGWGTITTARGGLPDKARVLHTVLPNGWHLLTGLDLRARQEMASEFYAGLGGAALMVLLTTAAGAWAFRRGFISRVAQLDAASRKIVAGQLQERLPVYSEHNELDLLSGTINRMLDQIAQLIDGVRNVSNTIAHDMRTPLAELRARLELALLRHTTGAALTTEVEGAVDDIDRLIGTFNALLRLAELDSGARRAGFVSVDLAAVVEQAVDLYQPVAEAKSITLATHLAERPSITGDAAMLAQAAANLLDNAVKFSPDGSEIAISIQRLADDAVAIVTADHGPGISPEDRSRVAERFYRGAASHGVQGIGLGLSLVAAIARLHDGELRLEDNQPGLRAEIVLPSGR